MKHYLVVAAVAAALSAVVAPASAQAPARPEAGPSTSDLATGQSLARRTSDKRRRAAGRAREAPPRSPAPTVDLVPGHHRVDHQTGLPNPSIPSR
jgi:hypothetical protein